MLRFLAVCAVLVVAAPVFADDKDKPKPNTLTPTEIADGWILLFDGESTFGWKTEGDVKVADGVLTLGGDKPTRITTTAGFGDAFDLRAEARAEGKGGPQVVLLFGGGGRFAGGFPQP